MNLLLAILGFGLFIIIGLVGVVLLPIIVGVIVVAVVVCVIWFIVADIRSDSPKKKDDDPDYL